MSKLRPARPAWLVARRPAQKRRRCAPLIGPPSPPLLASPPRLAGCAIIIIVPNFPAHSRTMTRRHRGPRGASAPEARSPAAPRDRRHRRFRSIRGRRTWITRRRRWRSPAIAPTWRPTTATTRATTTTTRLAGTTIIISGTTAPNERFTSKNEGRPRRRRGFHPRVRQHSGKPFSLRSMYQIYN